MKYRYKIRGHAPETIDRDYLNNFNSWDIIIDLCNAKGYNITLEDVEFVNIVPDEHGGNDSYDKGDYLNKKGKIKAQISLPPTFELSFAGHS